MDSELLLYRLCPLFLLHFLLLLLSLLLLFFLLLHFLLLLLPLLLLFFLLLPPFNNENTESISLRC